jgi:hypothetical protein
MKRFKAAGSSLRLINKFQVWEKNLNPICIGHENSKVISEYLDLIHNHPVRDRVVNKPEDYLYSSARDYAGMKGLVNVHIIEQYDEPRFILRHISSY